MGSRERLREICGHDSFSVNDCVYCEVADEIDSLVHAINRKDSDNQCKEIKPSARDCDACGDVPGTLIFSGATLCHDCDILVRETVGIIRGAGRQVNVVGVARKIYRERHNARNYILRDIPEELMLEMKKQSIADGVTVRELILKSAREHLAKR